MRASGVRRLLVDYSRCRHWERLSTEECDRWADDVRLSDLEPKFVCRECGQRGAEVRPDFQTRGKPCSNVSHVRSRGILPSANRRIV
jgi:hypothetical protein